MISFLFKLLAVPTIEVMCLTNAALLALRLALIKTFHLACWSLTALNHVFLAVNAQQG